MGLVVYFSAENDSLFAWIYEYLLDLFAFEGFFKFIATFVEISKLKYFLLFVEDDFELLQ